MSHETMMSIASDDCRGIELTIRRKTLEYLSLEFPNKVCLSAWEYFSRKSDLSGAQKENAKKNPDIGRNNIPKKSSSTSTLRGWSINEDDGWSRLSHLKMDNSHKGSKSGRPSPKLKRRFNSPRQKQFISRLYMSSRPVAENVSSKLRKNLTKMQEKVAVNAMTSPIPASLKTREQSCLRKLANTFSDLDKAEGSPPSKRNGGALSPRVAQKIPKKVKVKEELSPSQRPIGKDRSPNQRKSPGTKSTKREVSIVGSSKFPKCQVIRVQMPSPEIVMPDKIYGPSLSESKPRNQPKYLKLHDVCKTEDQMPSETNMIHSSTSMELSSSSNRKAAHPNQKPRLTARVTSKWNTKSKSKINSHRREKKEARGAPPNLQFGSSSLSQGSKKYRRAAGNSTPDKKIHAKSRSFKPCSWLHHSFKICHSSHQHIQHLSRWDICDNNCGLRLEFLDDTGTEGSCSSDDEVDHCSSWSSQSRGSDESVEVEISIDDTDNEGLKQCESGEGKDTGAEATEATSCSKKAAAGEVTDTSNEENMGQAFQHSHHEGADKYGGNLAQEGSGTHKISGMQGNSEALEGSEEERKFRFDVDGSGASSNNTDFFLGRPGELNNDDNSATGSLSEPPPSQGSTDIHGDIADTGRDSSIGYGVDVSIVVNLSGEFSNNIDSAAEDCGCRNKDQSMTTLSDTCSQDEREHRLSVKEMVKCLQQRAQMSKFAYSSSTEHRISPGNSSRSSTLGPSPRKRSKAWLRVDSTEVNNEDPTPDGENAVNSLEINRSLRPTPTPRKYASKGHGTIDNDGCGKGKKDSLVKENSNKKLFSNDLSIESCCFEDAENVIDDESSSMDQPNTALPLVGNIVNINLPVQDINLIALSPSQPPSLLDHTVRRSEAPLVSVTDYTSSTEKRENSEQQNIRHAQSHGSSDSSKNRENTQKEDVIPKPYEEGDNMCGNETLPGRCMEEMAADHDIQSDQSNLNFQHESTETKDENPSHQANGQHLATSLAEALERAKLTMRKIRSRSLSPSQVSAKINRFIERGKQSLSNVIKSWSNMDSTGSDACNATGLFELTEDIWHSAIVESRSFTSVPADSSENVDIANGVTIVQRSSEPATGHCEQCVDDECLVAGPRTAPIASCSYSGCSSCEGAVARPEYAALGQGGVLKYNTDVIASRECEPPNDDKANRTSLCSPLPCNGTLKQTRPETKIHGSVTFPPPSVSMRTRSPPLESILETDSVSDGGGCVQWCEACGEGEDLSESVGFDELPCEPLDQAETDSAFSEGKFERNQSPSCHYAFVSNQLLHSPVAKRNDGSDQVTSRVPQNEVPTRASLSDCSRDVRHDPRELSAQDDALGSTALSSAPLRTQSLLNASDTAPSESGITDMMALISQEASIKRYPSFPDLTDLNNTEGEGPGRARESLSSTELDSDKDCTDRESFDPVADTGDDQNLDLKENSLANIVDSPQDTDNLGSSSALNTDLKDRESSDEHIELVASNVSICGSGQDWPDNISTNISTVEDSLLRKSPPVAIPHEGASCERLGRHNSPQMGVQEPVVNVGTIVSLLESCKLLNEADIGSALIHGCNSANGGKGSKCSQGELDKSSCDINVPQAGLLGRRTESHRSGLYERLDGADTASIDYSEVEIACEITDPKPEQDGMVNSPTLQLPSPPAFSPSEVSENSGRLRRDRSEVTYTLSESDPKLNTSHNVSNTCGYDLNIGTASDNDLAHDVRVQDERIDEKIEINIKYGEVESQNRNKLFVKAKAFESEEATPDKSMFQINTDHNSVQLMGKDDDSKDNSSAYHAGKEEHRDGSENTFGLNKIESREVPQKPDGMELLQDERSRLQRNTESPSPLNTDDMLNTVDQDSSLSGILAISTGSWQQSPAEQHQALEDNTGKGTPALSTGQGESSGTGAMATPLRSEHTMTAVSPGVVSSETELNSLPQGGGTGSGAGGTPACDLSLTSQSRSHRSFSTDEDRSSGAGEQLPLTCEAEVKKTKKKKAKQLKLLQSGEGLAPQPDKNIRTGGTGGGSRGGPGPLHRSVSHPNSPDINTAAGSSGPPLPAATVGSGGGSQSPRPARAAISQQRSGATSTSSGPVRKEIKWDDEISCGDMDDMSTQSSSEMSSNKCNSCALEASKGRCHVVKRRPTSSACDKKGKDDFDKPVGVEEYSYKSKVIHSPPPAGMKNFNARSCLTKTGPPYTRKISALAKAASRSSSFYAARKPAAHGLQLSTPNGADISRSLATRALVLSQVKDACLSKSCANTIGAVDSELGKATTSLMPLADSQSPLKTSPLCEPLRQDNEEIDQTSSCLVESPLECENLPELHSAPSFVPDLDGSCQSASGSLATEPDNALANNHNPVLLPDVMSLETVSPYRLNMGPMLSSARKSCSIPSFITKSSELVDVTSSLSVPSERIQQPLSSSSTPSLASKKNLVSEAMHVSARKPLIAPSIPLFSHDDKHQQGLRETEYCGRSNTTFINKPSEAAATSSSTGDRLHSPCVATPIPNTTTTSNRQRVLSSLSQNVSSSDAGISRAYSYVSRSQSHLERCDRLIERSSDIIRRSEEMLAASRQQMARTVMTLSLRTSGVSASNSHSPSSSSFPAV